ncbi:riboflavin synthase subunit alpha [Uliginosibacterium sp. 31-16]|uniref:riboflavin synthase subunit alpha n=1 Tax=Uliginosibacterium sp. 31-16 TaxID=3068315 RepID=UPI00273F5530|nr:riboflavin synthase subunit alpha [Uliginosibacterium sp. 31-16]MDP5240671.1 riboflavin synthase subunit alpha [Uliginosibacterium sp. 31-16]
MFTGIVKGRASVRRIERQQGLYTLELAFPADFDAGLETGASVAVDGCCLTVTHHSSGRASFDVMQESLARTTLIDLNAGSEVNVERAARDGAEIGGHPLSGHVDCTASIVAIDTPENNKVMRFQLTPEWARYVFAKGYIAVNGCSLTVSDMDRASGQFSVWFIPETLRATTFDAKKPGDAVNIEIERATQVTVDTIRSYLDERLGPLLPRLEAMLLASGGSLEQLAALPAGKPDTPEKP